MNRGRAFIAAIAVLLWGTVTQARGAEEAPAIPWTVVARADALAVLELSYDPGSKHATALRFCELQKSGDRLAPKEWRDLAPLGVQAGSCPAIAAYHLPSGRWAIAMSESGAAGQSLWYVEIDQDLFTLRTPVEHDAASVITFVRLANQKPDELPLVCGSGIPCFVERDAVVYIIGESIDFHARRNPDPRFTWVAPAKAIEQPRLPGRVLANARVIGDGGQPHVVGWNGRFVVTTQVAQPKADGAWGKTVKVYESTDLETWKPMTAPDGALEFYDYDLTVAQGKLTVVGAVDASVRKNRLPRPPLEEYRPPLALVTLTYDPDKAAWQETSRRPDSTLSTKSEVKLLPLEVTGGALKLIRRETDGTYTTSAVAE